MFFVFWIVSLIGNDLFFYFFLNYFMRTCKGNADFEKIKIFYLHFNIMPVYLTIESNQSM